jgi:hypothetical protein
MAGGEIICGSFNGKAESGSAYRGVLYALEKKANAEAKKTIRRLKKPFGRKQDPDHVEILRPEAKILQTLLIDYKKELIKSIGHRDWSKATAEEEDAGLDTTEAQWGKGKGWQLYCVTDLIAACRRSVAEDESIHIVFL